MFLGDAHVKQALRELAHILQQPRTAGHGGSDGAHIRLLLGNGHQCISEGVGEGIDLGRQLLAGHRVEFSDAMKFCRVFLCGCIALALFGNHMNQGRLLQIPGGTNNRNQIVHVMAVHRAKILQPHIFKNGGLQQKMLDSLFCPAG